MRGIKYSIFFHENGTVHNSVKFCSTEPHNLINEPDEANAMCITLSDYTKINEIKNVIKRYAS